MQAPPSTWVLLRLSRFAKPYRKELIAGFLLTLASTAATLVPPYLTIPLMDDILIPFQNGKSIDPMQVVWLLLGLLGAALAAWGLNWARTYLLALVAERMAPICAPPPSSICCSCRSTTLAANAPAI